MTEVLHHLMRELIEYSIILLELIGVLVLLAGALRATVNYIKGDPNNRPALVGGILEPACRAQLAEGIALALEFKLGGEILRTVIVREFSEIALVGCIIVLRAGLSFLIHWAIRTEEKDQAEEKLEECNVEVLDKEKREKVAPRWRSIKEVI